MKKAILYVRVSTDEQGISVRNQVEKLEAYCKMQDLEIVDTVIDEGISGSIELHKRPAGKRLINLEGINHVVALKLDRLFRDAADALIRTKEWDKKNIALHLVDMGGQTINTSTAMGRFFLNTMAGFAELERNLISERTKAALKNKKAHSEVYNHVPYGFDAVDGKLIKNELEQTVIQAIKKDHIQGFSLRAIAKKMMEMGFPTKNGGSWHPQNVKNILQMEVA